VVSRFCTPLYEHTSLGFNGILIDWSSSHLLWLNPPWNILPLVLDKMIASKARGVLISPVWPLHPWFAKAEACSLFSITLPAPRKCVRTHTPDKVDQLLHRDLVLRAMVFGLS
jgi:hypothetical protein